MHFDMTSKDKINPDVDVTYQTVDLFSPEKRFMYFISDVPHLLKTARNCRIQAVVVNSHDTCRMEGYFYSGITFQIYYMKTSIELHILQKWTYGHLKLTPCSGIRPNFLSKVS